MLKKCSILDILFSHVEIFQYFRHINQAILKNVFNNELNIKTLM